MTERHMPGEACEDCGRILHGFPCIHHEDDCPHLVGAGRAVQDDGLPPDSPERRFLLGMVDTLYGGGDKPEDLSARLLVIADVLDKVDAVTDSYVAERGADHRVGRSFQADLREAADRLRAAPPLHDPRQPPEASDE